MAAMESSPADMSGASGSISVPVSYVMKLERTLRRLGSEMGECALMKLVCGNGNGLLETTDVDQLDRARWAAAGTTQSARGTIPSIRRAPFFSECRCKETNQRVRTFADEVVESGRDAC